MEEDESPTRRKAAIEIPLRSERKYVPGSGPALPQISLLPVHDSTGYIIDQFVLPTDQDMKPDSRRLLHYHIGFTDLPAAKLLIPCHKVLDYISPRELEEWESRNFERLDAQRKTAGLALKEKKMAKKKAAEAAAIAEGKRPVGRPPKTKPRDSRSPASTTQASEALTMVEQVAGPSLSTPKKRKMSMPLEREDTVSDVESDEAAIQRQLHPDFVNDQEWQLRDAEEGQWAGKSEAEPIGQSGLPSFETSGAETSQASSLAPSRRGVLPPLSQPLPSGRKETPIPPPNLNQHSLPSKAKTGVTAIPRPKQTPIPPPIPGQASGLFTKPKHKPATPAQTCPAIPGNIHPAFAAAFGARTEAKVGSRNGAADPKTPKSTPAKSHGTQQSKTSTPARRAESLKIAQWTPVAVSRGRFSRTTPGSSSTASVSQDQIQETGSQKSEKKAPKPRKRKAPASQEEVYDVKELLDDRWITEKGKKTHKYLVLWAGQWPEGQNPTWEPANNIEDKELIRQYHEKKALGIVRPPPKKMQKTLRSYILTGKQYRSVAEAFEDGLDVVEPSNHQGNDEEEDVDMHKEEFLKVVDNLHPQYAKSLSFHVKKEKEGGGASGKVVDASFSAFDASLARYQQSFKGAPRGAF